MGYSQSKIEMPIRCDTYEEALACNNKYFVPSEMVEQLNSGYIVTTNKHIESQGEYKKMRCFQCGKNYGILEIMTKETSGGIDSIGLFLSNYSMFCNMNGVHTLCYDPTVSGNETK